MKANNVKYSLGKLLNTCFGRQILGNKYICVLTIYIKKSFTCLIVIAKTFTIPMILKAGVKIMINYIFSEHGIKRKYISRPQEAKVSSEDFKFV